MRGVVRPGTPADLSAIRELLPRLASFDVPERRNPEDLWRGDERALEAWARGEKQFLVHVADDDGLIVGVAVTSLRPEMLSGEPSAHLEVLAVAEGSEGVGVGSSLCKAAEAAAKAEGALSMTLHVFANNRRARSLYDKRGFDGELLRMSKLL